MSTTRLSRLRPSMGFCSIIGMNVSISSTCADSSMTRIVLEPEFEKVPLRFYRRFHKAGLQRQPSPAPWQTTCSGATIPTPALEQLERAALTRARPMHNASCRMPVPALASASKRRPRMNSGCGERREEFQNGNLVATKSSVGGLRRRCCRHATTPLRQPCCRPQVRHYCRGGVRHILKRCAICTGAAWPGVRGRRPCAVLTRRRGCKIQSRVLLSVLLGGQSSPHAPYSLGGGPRRTAR